MILTLSWNESLHQTRHGTQFGRRGGDWAGGDFMGIPAGPGPYVRDFAAMYRFEDGKIAERWVVRDDLGMLRQLGAIGDQSG